MKVEVAKITPWIWLYRVVDGGEVLYTCPNGWCSEDDAYSAGIAYAKHLNGDVTWSAPSWSL